MLLLTSCELSVGCCLDFQQQLVVVVVVAVLWSPFCRPFAPSLLLHLTATVCWQVLLWLHQPLTTARTGTSTESSIFSDLLFTQVVALTTAMVLLHHGIITGIALDALAVTVLLHSGTTTAGIAHDDGYQSCCASGADVFLIVVLCRSIQIAHKAAQHSF